MDIEAIKDNFEQKGWFIHKVENIDEIKEVQQKIADYLRFKYSIKESDNEILLNTVHTHIKGIDDAYANSLVVELLEGIKNDINIGNIIYRASPEPIDYYLGNDVLCQRNQNIVFQYPYSNRFSELHTDAPNNSLHEIVYWLPLVNCYETKSFFIVEHNQSEVLLERYLNKEFKSWDEFKESAIEKAIHLEIKVGEVLGFWSGLLHGSLINETQESRFSLNMRYKNMFAPHGLKNPLTFYKPMKFTGLTRMAIGSIYTK